MPLVPTRRGLLEERFPELIQVKDAPEHLGPFCAPQRQELAELALRKHNRPAEFLTAKPDDLFHGSRHGLGPVGKHLSIILDKPGSPGPHALPVSIRSLLRVRGKPFIAALDGITASSEFESEQNLRRFLTQVDNPSRVVLCSIDLAVQDKRNGVQDGGFSASRRSEDTEQPVLPEFFEIDSLAGPIAVEA